MCVCVCTRRDTVLRIARRTSLESRRRGKTHDTSGARRAFITTSGGVSLRDPPPALSATAARGRSPPANLLDDSRQSYSSQIIVDKRIETGARVRRFIIASNTDGTRGPSAHGDVCLRAPEAHGREERKRDAFICVYLQPLVCWSRLRLTSCAGSRASKFNVFLLREAQKRFHA